MFTATVLMAALTASIISARSLPAGAGSVTTNLVPTRSLPEAPAVIPAGFGTPVVRVYGNENKQEGESTQDTDAAEGSKSKEGSEAEEEESSKTEEEEGPKAEKEENSKAEGEKGSKAEEGAAQASGQSRSGSVLQHPLRDQYPLKEFTT